MKIGIITFHRAVNFGAVLQAAALEKILEELYPQDTVEMIDYRNPLTEKIYYPSYIDKSRIVKSMLSIPLQYRTKKIKRDKFFAFNKRYMNISKRKFLDINELAEAETEYDCFITGSDQVFSMECTEFDEAYFLTFVKEGKKKNSYAASFGFDKIPSGYEEDYKKRLQGYQNISVREKSGKKIIENILPGAYDHICVTLDPTLLLSKKVWQNFITPIKRKEKYILLYAVRKPEFFDIAKKLARKTGCKILYINDRRFFGEKGIEYVHGISPDEFLGYFWNAEYIITNSFHGTVFSILFEKEFWVETNSYGKINNRAKDLMDLLEIKNRDLSMDVEKGIHISEKINWKQVQERLLENREKSIEYLKMIKGGA